MKNNTEHGQAKAPLPQGDELFRFLWEHPANAFFVMDATGRIVDVNQSACNSVGYTRKEFLAMNVWDLDDEAPIAYFSIGIDTRIRQANKRAAELLGCPMPELLGRSLFDFIADTPTGKPKAQNLLQKLLAGEEVRSEEMEARRADSEQE